eukprot:gene16752-biopygen760
MAGTKLLILKESNKNHGNPRSPTGNKFRAKLQDFGGVGKIRERSCTKRNVGTGHNTNGENVPSYLARSCPPGGKDPPPITGRCVMWYANFLPDAVRRGVPRAVRAARGPPHRRCGAEMRPNCGICGRLEFAEEN